MSQAGGVHQPPRGKALAALALGALGVVYGDIGTSPLYAIKECFGGVHSVPLSHENVLGILSLIFWALNLVVSYKYVGVMLRADNRGEGGILALMALADWKGKPSRYTSALFAVGIFGAALLYGDGIITPAISVLGAIEGLGVATHGLEPWVVWISLAIIVVFGGLTLYLRDKTFILWKPTVLYWLFGAVLAGVDMVFDAGCIEGGLLFSPELLVIADELARMTRLAVEPTEVSEETIALDVIAKVGPGEIYLGEDHTLAHFRELWLPRVLAWEGRDAWEAAGSKTLLERAREKVFEVWETHEVEPLPDDVLAGMRAVIEARRAIVPPE